MTLKKITIFAIIAVLAFSAFSFFPQVSGLWNVPASQRVGFQDGSYIGFADPMVFVTPVDGGSTRQIPSTNATFGDWMFFQQQGSTFVYGFWATGCNISVTVFFVNNVLAFTADGAGTVKVYVGSLGAPTLITGATGVFNNVLRVATLTIPAAGLVQMTMASYTVTLSRSGNSPTVGDTLIPVAISVSKNGFVLTSYLVNITRDGVAFAQNVDISFSDSEPSPITRLFSVSGLYDTDINTAITDFSVVSLSITWVPVSQGGNGGNPTPTPAASPSGSPTPLASSYPTAPAPTPYHTPTPLGTNDFQIDNVDLGTINTNSTVTANLHFRYSGSSYTLQTITLSEPFQTWYIQNIDLSQLSYILAGTESSGDAPLTFEIPEYMLLQTYGGTITVSALDSFGNTHTSSAAISANMVGASQNFDLVKWISNPVTASLIAIGIIAILVVIAFFSKRHH